MRITLTSYGTTVSIETEHDDLNLMQISEHLECLLKAAGYNFNGDIRIGEEQYED